MEENVGGQLWGGGVGGREEAERMMREEKQEETGRKGGEAGIQTMSEKKGRRKKRE